jgi:heat-inducible transcriptional repressor
VLTLVVAAMGELERSHTVQSYREGLVHLLAQPEFRNRESFSQVLSFLDSDWLAVKVLPRVFAANGVSVIIGGHDWLEMGDYGLVLTKYGSRSDVMGALGVLGPMRMQYERVIPAVRYMASLLNGLILSLFGPGGQQKGEDQLCDPGTLREVGDSER